MGRWFERSWFWALLVIVVVGAGYGHTLPYAYNFDDVSSIRTNATLDDPTDLGAIFSFRPTRFVLHHSFATNIAVTGREPDGLRLVNILIHAIAAGLVGGLGAWLARTSGAFSATKSRVVGGVAALLFAAHPLATQAVTYVVQRTASLAGLFELGAVFAYALARTGDRHRGWFVGVSAVCALSAAFTKEMSVALPLLVLLVESVAARREGRRVPHRAALAFFAVPVLVALVSLAPANEPGLSTTRFRETDDIGRVGYLATQLEVVPRYLGLVVWPANQNLDPDVPVRTSPTLAGVAALVGFVAIAALAVRLRRRWPVVAIGVAWCICALLPESSLFPIRDVMNEHRMYVPLVGIAWVVASMVVRLPARVGVAAVILTRERAHPDDAHAKPRVGVGPHVVVGRRREVAGEGAGPQQPGLGVSRAGPSGRCRGVVSPRDRARTQVRLRARELGTPLRRKRPAARCPSRASGRNRDFAE